MTNIAPDDWTPSDLDRAWIKGECPHVDIDSELTKFLNHEFQRPLTNWAKAFRLWCKRAEDRAEKPPNRAYVPPWEKIGCESEEQMHDAFRAMWVKKYREWLKDHGSADARALAEKVLGEPL